MDSTWGIEDLQRQVSGKMMFWRKKKGMLDHLRRKRKSDLQKQASMQPRFLKLLL